MNINNTQPLLTEYMMGDLKLPNRVVMAPMTRSRANNPENAPNEMMATYYRQRATAGLIITEGSQVSPEGVGYVHTPGIHSQAQVDGWKKVTDAVHDEGGRIFIQLWHVGRISHPEFHGGSPPPAPSALNPHTKVFTSGGMKDTVTPRAMTIDEIHQTIDDFRNAAVNAMKAGFDGVEIHSSNGYLLHQFFSPTSNIRTDEYGGSIKNRARILFEIIDQIRQVMPQNRIGARFNPSLHGIFGMTVGEETIPTFDYIIQELNDYNLAYVHMSEPFTDVSDVPFAEPDIAGHYRPMYNGTFIINSNFDREKGNHYINEDLADLVSFGKLFISNPDLPKRFDLKARLTEWDKDTFYGGDEKGYTNYPAMK